MSKKLFNYVIGNAGVVYGQTRKNAVLMRVSEHKYGGPRRTGRRTAS